MGHFLEPIPNTTAAYHQDALDDEYYGKAPKGRKVSDSVWQIFKIVYTTGVGTNKDWIILYPVDTTTGKASDQPKFIWDDDGTGSIVETYVYRELGT